VLVHPDASISRYASIGAGTVICAQAAVIIDSRIGLATIINTGASVGHDCVLEDGVHVAPGARLAGAVSVGACSWIGIGATVKERVRIGRAVTVGAGSTIIRDVPDHVTVVGSPGRIIRVHA
jgi:sugar O-acyltransferase (sialic acid O-acetyltransferase NeuD family)